VLFDGKKYVVGRRGKVEAEKVKEKNRRRLGR